MSVLQTVDLKKYYGTEPNITRALDGVNFSVEDGEFVAVVGTSGSGMLYSIEIPLYENPKSVSPKSAHRILSVSIAPRIV